MIFWSIRRHGHIVSAQKIAPVNSMTAKDNSWAAAAEAKLNATYARHIQRTGGQPRALVSELGPRPVSQASDPRSDRVSGSAHDVCIGSIASFWPCAEHFRHSNNGHCEKQSACRKRARNGHRRCLRDDAPGSRNSGSMSGKITKILTISPIDPTKCWFFDFDCYLTNTDGFARGVSDELEQQRRFFDDTKPHS